MTPPYDVPIHKVTIIKDSILDSIFHKDELAVNSYHHQAVKHVAENAEVMAISEDGLVEAISIKGQSFSIGVQWHPEFSYLTSDDSMKLVQEFVDACGIKQKS